MNEDLKQMIEKEAVRYAKDLKLINASETRMIGEAIEHGANLILSKWQEAERWRKVEEELPKDGALVLAKWEALDPEHTEIKVLSYSVELGFITADELGDCDDNVTHWKPIND